MDSAIHYYKESLQYAVEEEQPDFAANALYILGSINIQLGNAERALKYLYKSLEIYQGLDEIYDQCLTMLSLGEVYELFGDAERAEKFYMDALEIAESIETRTVLADVYAHLGSLAKNQKNIEKSLAYYRKSEKLSEELQYASGYIGARKKIGQILCEKDSVDIGIEYLESALELAELIVDFYESCDVHLKLGKQYLKKGEQNKAIHHLEEVYRLSENTNWRILREESARLLSTSYADKGQLQKAYDFLLIANDLSDSLNSADNQRALYEKEYDFKKAADSAKVVSILTQNNLDKVEVELKLEKRNKLVTNLIFVLILILGGILLTSLVIRARNKQREITFQQKSEKLKQQALLAQMNPHFLFNSLNSIQAIYTKGEITAANDFLADFGTLLRRILEFSSVETIRLSEEIELLDLYLRLEKIRAGKAIQYKIECGPDLATEIIQIPPMLIQPLIENAIIHGLKPKEKGGIIRIKFSEIEEGIMCIIEDDGVGLHAEKRVKFSDRKSLGLKILKERLGTRGKLLLEELETGGTRAVLIVRS